MTEENAASTADTELEAIRLILSALHGLENESIERVFDYIFSRLGMEPSRRSTAREDPIPYLSNETASVTRTPSIRDLKEEKQPESSNQMAALVAYYLADVVEGDARKESVNAADLERYFKQAGFKLPNALAKTLPHATDAGYFEPIGDGRYKLTPVGYNLVVHGMPRSHMLSKQKSAPAPLRKKH